MSHTAHENLTHIATEWPALRALLTTPTTATWPPAGLDTYLSHLDEDALADYHHAQAAERAERTATAPGERPAPIRASVLDTITELEGELLALADEIASAVQRPAFTTQFRSAAPNDDVARSLALMGLKDQQDERRWRFNMAHRDGRKAAQWLADRLTGVAGPFQPLDDVQRQRIATVATACRNRLDKALGQQAYEDTPLGRHCTKCGGEIIMSSGAQDFTIWCSGTCGDSWSGTQLLDGLSAA